MNILKKLSLINASLLTVITFIAGSFIGGAILYITESGREVTNLVPTVNEIEIKPLSFDDSNQTKEYTLVENHTFLKEVKYSGERYIDMVFTAASALCVTGLTSTDFASFTPAGQFVVMILIQIGGLGIIVFTSILAFGIFRGLSERLSIKKFLSSVMDSEHHDVTDMLKYVFAYTIIFEFTGFLIMGIHLSNINQPELINNINPWWWSLFHSISAFNNAGFGLLNNNLMNFVTDPIINLTIASLIILGGLGYPVLIAIYFAIKKRLKIGSNKSLKDLKLDISGVASIVQIRVALIGTVIFLLAGTLIPLIIESTNPIEVQFSFGEKVLINFFQSVSTRTAGFNTIDIGSLHIATLFFYIGLMFIGANPAGTAGGIKIPTFAVLYGYIKDWFMAPRQPVKLLGRSVSKFAVSHAIRLFFFSVIFIVTIVFFITLFESKYLITPDPLFNFNKVLFEVVSAFGTVGLSMGYRDGVTSFSAILSDPSKILIIITMLFGRVGPLTVLYALPWKRAHDNAPLSPDYENSDRIQIG